MFTEGGSGGCNPNKLTPIIRAAWHPVESICDHFKKGFCRFNYSQCLYYNIKEVVCRDFQMKRCQREDCRYLHMERQEERTLLEKLTKENVKHQSFLKNEGKSVSMRLGSGKGIEGVGT